MLNQNCEDMTQAWYAESSIKWISCKIRQNMALQAKETNRTTIHRRKLIKNKFSITVPNKLWCTDITELSCQGTKLYLYGIIDVATRRIVGWSIAKNQTQVLVQDAFKMAIGRNLKLPKEQYIIAIEDVNIRQRRRKY